jgi:hypothetical protein
VLPKERAFIPVLYANRGFLWSNAGTARTDTNVCWVNPNGAPGATSADRADRRDQRRRAVEEWSRHAHIDFYGWDGNDPVIPLPAASGQPGCTLSFAARRRMRAVPRFLQAKPNRAVIQRTMVLATASASIHNTTPAPSCTNVAMRLAFTTKECGRMRRHEQYPGSAWQVRRRHHMAISGNACQGLWGTLP